MLDITVLEDDFLTRVEFGLPSSHELSDAEVIYRLPVAEDAPSVPICGPIIFVGVFRDLEGREWLNKYRFMDRSGQQQEITFLRDVIRFDAASIARLLVRRGFELFASPAELVQLMHSLCPQNLLDGYHMSSFGWFGPSKNVFVLPDGTFIHRSAFKHALHFTGTPVANSISSSLETWKVEVGELVRGNPLMILSALLGLIGPLQPAMDLPSFAIMLYGTSSGGKSSAGELANTMFPALPIIAGNGTFAGIEANIVERPGFLLVIDEMRPGKNLVEIIYMIGNEKVKARGKPLGGAQRHVTFRLPVLMTSEASIAELARLSGVELYNGNLVRLLDLPLDDEFRYGAFENLHGRSDAGAFAEELVAAAQRNAGALGQAFIEKIIRSPLKAKINKETYNKYLSELQRETGQLDDRLMRRGLQKFAGLLLLADIIARLDLVPWSFEESREAILWAARNWTKNVEFCRPRPAEHLLTKIERLVAEGQLELLNLDTEIGDENASAVDAQGWLDEEYYYLKPSTFRDLVVNGGQQNPARVKLAARHLLEADMLERDNHSGYQSRMRVAQIGRQDRVYKIRRHEV